MYVVNYIYNKEGAEVKFGFNERYTREHFLHSSYDLKRLISVNLL